MPVDRRVRHLAAQRPRRAAALARAAAAAADNAAMESFYALLQKNVLNRRARWRTRDELASEIIVWTEHTYNRRRRQRALGRLSPVAYELAFTTPLCLEDNELAA